MSDDIDHDVRVKNVCTCKKRTSSPRHAYFRLLGIPQMPMYAAGGSMVDTYTI